MESHYVHKAHNVSVLMYHIVCAAKYRRVVMSEQVDEVLKAVCLEIAKRWEIWFLEIGVDRITRIFWCNQFRCIVRRGLCKR